MSLDFVVAADRVNGPNLTLGETITAFAWVRPDSMGSGNVGTVFCHGTGGAGARRERIMYNGTASSNVLRFRADRATTDGIWDFDTTVSLSVWTSVAATYDGSSVSNDPIAYLNGSPITVTEITGPPSGARNADGELVRMGTRSDVGADEWDGKIGEFALWTRILTAAEIAVVHAYGPLAVPGLPTVYWRLPDSTTTAYDYSGNGNHGTTTGATAAEEPPIPHRAMTATIAQ